MHWPAPLPAGKPYSFATSLAVYPAGARDPGAKPFRRKLKLEVRPGLGPIVQSQNGHDRAGQLLRHLQRTDAAAVAAPRIFIMGQADREGPAQVFHRAR